MNMACHVEEAYGLAVRRKGILGHKGGEARFMHLPVKAKGHWLAPTFGRLASGTTTKGYRLVGACQTSSGVHVAGPVPLAVRNLWASYHDQVPFESCHEGFARATSRRFD